MRHCIILNILALSLVCAFATPAMADGKLPWKGGGSGDWNGQRTHLDELGLTFWWINDNTAQQNVKGGTGKGGAVFNRSVLEINYQFEPLTPLKGSEIQVSANWSVGTGVNDYVGALLNSTGIFFPSAARLYELYWGQFFADKQVHFKIGRISTCPGEYATPRFLNAGAISNGYYCQPGALYINQPAAANVYPIGTWGARFKVEPKHQDFQIWLGAYNGWPRNLSDADKHGVDFTLNLRKSTYVVGEFWYKLKQDPGDRGLPGNYRIGGLYDSAQFTRLDNSTQTERGNPGWYLFVDQMLFRERPTGTPSDSSKWKGGWKESSSSEQGFYAMANFFMHPKRSINLAPYWVSAALFYQGAIPHRDSDVLSFGFYYASLSPFSALDYELQLRVYYTLQFTPWFLMSPHMHWFRKPGGGQVPRALVFGLFFHFTL